MPGEPRSRLILRGAIGFAIGLTLWIAASRPYDDLIAAAAGPILRRIEPTVTWVRTVGPRIAVDRTDGVIEDRRSRGQRAPATGFETG